MKPGCHEIGNRRVGRYYYCWYHLRSWSMRNQAVATGKKFPSADDVDKMFAALNNMQCPVCKRTMVLHTSLGTRSIVASLQHDNDGHMRIICSGCNSAHCRIGDVIYKIPDDHRRCHVCAQIKPKEKFHKDRCVFGGICKSCRSNQHKRRLANIKMDAARYKEHLRRKNIAAKKSQTKKKAMMTQVACV